MHDRNKVIRIARFMARGYKSTAYAETSLVNHVGETVPITRENARIITMLAKKLYPLASTLEILNTLARNRKTAKIVCDSVLDIAGNNPIRLHELLCRVSYGDNLQYLRPWFAKWLSSQSKEELHRNLCICPQIASLGVWLDVPIHADVRAEWLYPHKAPVYSLNWRLAKPSDRILPGTIKKYRLGYESVGHLIRRHDENILNETDIVLAVDNYNEVYVGNVNTLKRLIDPAAQRHGYIAACEAAAHIHNESGPLSCQELDDEVPYRVSCTPFALMHYTSDVNTPRKFPLTLPMPIVKEWDESQIPTLPTSMPTIITDPFGRLNQIPKTTATVIVITSSRNLTGYDNTIIINHNPARSIDRRGNLEALLELYRILA